MARQGLMDDSGYDFLEPTDCSNFETCTEVAYQQGFGDGFNAGCEKFSVGNDYQQGRADERPKAFANGYEKGYQQGRADALNIDMDKPMHFTDEQKAWVKNYIILNAERQRADAIEEFVKYIENEMPYDICDGNEAVEEIKKFTKKFCDIQ